MSAVTVYLLLSRLVFVVVIYRPGQTVFSNAVVVTFVFVSIAGVVVVVVVFIIIADGRASVVGIVIIVIIVVIRSSRS